MAAQTNSDSLEPLRWQLVEIREMLVELLQQNGDERAGARLGLFAVAGEVPISLEEAAKLVWGRSVAKERESLECHVEILKGWATAGLNGNVLETDVLRRKWVTSREAVERFKGQIGLPRRDST